MHSAAQIKGLYAIVDDAFADPVKLAGQILDGGCRVLQLRSKNLSTGAFLKTASEIKTRCSARGALFIVNDRVDIALAVHADGVHLGQDDLPLSAARKLMGRKIIGISTHNVAEATAAQQGGADYIGFGPLFKTETKKDAHAVQGLEAVREVRRKTALPLVAIGGITLDNMAEALAAGADAAAVISVLARAADVAGMTAELMKKWG